MSVTSIAWAQDVATENFSETVNTEEIDSTIISTESDPSETNLEFPEEQSESSKYIDGTPQMLMVPLFKSEPVLTKIFARDMFDVINTKYALPEISLSLSFGAPNTSDDIPNLLERYFVTQGIEYIIFAEVINKQSKEEKNLGKDDEKATQEQGRGTQFFDRTPFSMQLQVYSVRDYKKVSKTSQSKIRGWHT